MPSTDDLLYKELGVDCQASAKNNTSNDAEGVAQAAKDKFDDFLEGLDNDVDQEIDDLLDWWSNSGLDTSKYRLTHYAITNNERSKQVTPIMEKFVEDHFGAANCYRLQGWDTHSMLELVTNGKYTTKNGDFVKALIRAPLRQLLPELDAIHIQKTSIFAKFLQFESKEESSKALKSLKSRHAKEYCDVTSAKVLELKWQGYVRDYGFPEAWNNLVAKHITAATEVSYKQSTYELLRNRDLSMSNVLQATVEDEDKEQGDLEQENASLGTSARQSDANALNSEGDTTIANKSSDN
ncbi:hypothetical protein Q7P35_005173 [Cladosporium inversicolor]